eukprot:TRINITY_DN8117_c0_g1_i2.p1 TRINITY_DN8117_c0_g1~~TRINITY_DN8117_c0_g1_i2.p1  ORF type:complete len:538 (-),score=67.49 TRINITY_DN8117_c0_g1_i2:14-1627(-)
MSTEVVVDSWEDLVDEADVRSVSTERAAPLRSYPRQPTKIQGLDLPTDVVWCILRFLPYRWLLVVRLVNREFCCIADEALSKLVLHCSPSRSLQIVSNFRQVQKLRLPRESSGGGFYNPTEFIHCLTNLEQLTSLCVDKCELGGYVLLSIGRQCKSLLSIRLLGWSALNTNDMNQFLCTVPQLTSLTTDSAQYAPTEGLIHVPRLKKLRCHTARSMPTLEALAQSGAALETLKFHTHHQETEGWQAMLSRCGATIRKLHLSFVNAPFTILVDLIAEHCVALQELHIPKPITAPALALAPLADRLRVLQLVSLTEEGIVAVLSPFTKLRRLDLLDSHGALHQLLPLPVHQGSIADLAKPLRLMQSFCARLNDKSVTALVRTRKNLTVLTSPGGTISETGCGSIAQFCVGLRTLNLSDNRITDAALKHIPLLRSLRHLDISLNPLVTDRGVYDVAKCSTLRTLNLTQCRITDQSLYSLMRGCTRLRRVTTERCLALSQASLGYLTGMTDPREDPDVRRGWRAWCDSVLGLSTHSDDAWE